MPRYLVVANQTLGGTPLLDLLGRISADGPTSFHVVVPAAPPKDGFTWSEERAYAAAAVRLDQARTHLSAMGAQVSGEIGDANPLLAVADALRVERFDAIVLSTLPAGASRWLGLDLPTRMHKTFALPVHHVVCPIEPRTAGVGGDR